MELSYDHHVWKYDLDKHRWNSSISHDKIKPNDILAIFKKNWKSVCDGGEQVFYAHNLKLEDTGMTIQYTTLRNQLETLSEDEREIIMADAQSIFL
jgi:hypothetical protein